MLKQILDSAGLNVRRSAELLGVDPKMLHEWTAGQSAIPDSFVRRLSTVLGVAPETLRSYRKIKGHEADIAPAIWFKFRGEGLKDVDRECVFLIRQLGYYLDQLEKATGSKSTGWNFLFESIRRDTDKQAPPREQGRQAARMFRQTIGLRIGHGGIGEIFRGNLRSNGVLIIESPLPDSNLEGCCFYLGATSLDRPCLFSNTYKRTWFRGNHILLHELGHAIFEACVEGASIDLLQGSEQNPSLSEERAQAFARECLIPREMLVHMSATLGVDWHALTPTKLAELVAKVHAEQRAVLSAAFEYEFITQEELSTYFGFDITRDLKEFSDRALTAEEFIKKRGLKPEWQNKRNTTIPSRSLRLPSTYIHRVLEAVQGGQISASKAAELLMIDETTFYERFHDKVPSYAD